MILINDIWIQVYDFQDVSNVIRKYYNRDLADALDEIVKESEAIIDEEKNDLRQEIDDLIYCIGEREDRINEYSIQVRKLEDEISELKERRKERNENC